MGASAYGGGHPANVVAAWQCPAHDTANQARARWMLAVVVHCRREESGAGTGAGAGTGTDTGTGTWYMVRGVPSSQPELVKNDTTLLTSQNPTLHYCGWHDSHAILYTAHTVHSDE